MPFGLKNAGATYQRLVDKAFDRQISQNLEIYVDDLVIKIHTETELLRDIEETFRTLRKINMKLNPKKCTFRAAEGMFLRYMISPEGIKLCPDKTEAVLQLPSPRTIKEVQSLNGKLASLNRFLSKSAEKSLPLFKTLKKCIEKSDFHWTPEAEQAFKQLKQHLAKLPMLVAPKPKEEQMMYLSASYGAISVVLMTERDTVQTQVPRSKNKKADALSKIASTSFAHLSKQVLVEILKEKSIQEKEVAAVVEEEGPTWMTPIIEYLRDETLPNDRKEASKLRIKARQYELLEGILYRRSFLKPWLRATIRGRQGHAGIDIAGPFPEGPGKVKFLIVAMDYFTKWIEAKAVATISGSQVKKFVWDNIVCRFGLPGEIVSDNGKQFSGDPFKDWCEKLNIVQRFASVKHPQSNGLVERANRSLGEGIKARLGEGNKNWLEELPHVLWAHRTMIKSSNDDTPFSLTYGTEAVIPAEIGMPTYRTAVVDVVHNDEELRLNLDLLEERRERAAIREAKAKSNMTKYYNARVRGVTFRPGDFVYRSNDASHAVDGGKLGPKWEGPYEVTEALGDGAYKLRSTDGTVLPRTWNIANLKKCYL
ncbi:reverse transcriptase domain-containing protein [Tanacetum coccineum]